LIYSGFSYEPRPSFSVLYVCRVTKSEPLCLPERTYCRLPLVGFADRQLNPEGRSLSFVADHPDFTTMLIDNALTDGQT